ncbi:hypothetical protein HanPSC8_Chr12g0539441 [Helianthus annuus]|nr:hypothetical protein HanPSC8_Chr12g0539441 [Helianthus annuus]
MNIGCVHSFMFVNFGNVFIYVCLFMFICVRSFRGFFKLYFYFIGLVLETLKP